MKLNLDNATTIAALVAATAGALASQEVYPRFFGVVAAVATAWWGYLTNKVLPPVKRDRL